MEKRKLVEETQFLVIDFETITPKGISPQPIEVGILRINGNRIDKNASVDWLIRPSKGLHLTKFDTEQTGIREEELLDKPNAEHIMKKIDGICEKGNYIFIAQNAKYEANILSHYIKECPNVKKVPVIDTILLAKYVLPNLSNYKLNTLANAVGEPIPENRHRALTDCFLTAKIYLKLLKLQEQKGKIKYLDELLSIAEIETPYNKCEQMQLMDFMDKQ